ncbi:MAG: SPOR domain-containing protein [Leptolyngbya sp. PLA3]|nr:MAG: SPOR domain-containing protein [Cyanobacteria bacterium CYA]MCE7969537.1 SPOR domain-containing protein [Leptolyngbya sp. PL-A3]
MRSKVATIVTMLLVGPPGCSTTQEETPEKPLLVDVFGRPVEMKEGWSGSTVDTVRVPTSSGQKGWTIVLLALDDVAQAENMLAQVRTTGRLPDAFMMERNGRHVIAVGSYDDPAQRIAQVELQRVRTIEIDGQKPYEHSFLAPPSGELARGSIPEYDLRNARRQYGDKAVYSLQVAVYGREDDQKPTETDLTQFRAAAEKAATGLRQEGELAFYYHGPNRSMVTIGIFGEDDVKVDRGVTTESARLQLARDRHPLNLLNGRTIVEQVRTSTGGKVPRNQASFLVKVPD